MEITFIIKTFERKKCLIRLLRSIREKFDEDIKVIIADDSKIPSMDRVKGEFGNLIENYISLPYDVGPSVGRHKALEKVKTKYFMLCDDDFIFDKRIDIGGYVEKMEKNNIDILGGKFININGILFRTLSFIKGYLRKKINVKLMKKKYESTFFGKIDTKKREILENRHYGYFKNSRIKKVDFTNNFLIGKTKKILESGGWLGLSHIGPEHLEFFVRMKKKNLIIGYDESLYIVHNQPLKITYLMKRFRKYKNTDSLIHNYKK